MYPKRLHDLHNDYPLATEKIEVTYDMLSKYGKDIADSYGIKVGRGKKLIPNLGDKKTTFFIIKIYNITCHLR